MGTFGASFWNRWSKPFRFIFDLDKLAKDQHLTLSREMTLAFWRWWEDWEQQQQQTRWTEAKVITSPPNKNIRFMEADMDSILFTALSPDLRTPHRHSISVC